MPIPKVEMPTLRKYDEWNKVNQILCDLTNMGYDVGKARDIIIVIEKYHLDKSLFDYPYDSFDEFKRHVLSGQYDFDRKSAYMSDEEREELDKAVKEGRLWATY